MDFGSEIMDFIEEKCIECQQRQNCEELCQRMEMLYDTLDKELNESYEIMIKETFDAYR